MGRFNYTGRVSHEPISSELQEASHIALCNQLRTQITSHHLPTLKQHNHGQTNRHHALPAGPRLPRTRLLRPLLLRPPPPRLLRSPPKTLRRRPPRLRRPLLPRRRAPPIHKILPHQTPPHKRQGSLSRHTPKHRPRSALPMDPRRGHIPAPPTTTHKRHAPLHALQRKIQQHRNRLRPLLRPLILPPAHLPGPRRLPRRKTPPRISKHAHRARRRRQEHP